MALVLVVDDSRIVRKIACTMLAALKFETVEAAHGEEALAQCRRHIPDGILLDWNMPVMDGLAFLRALRTLTGGERPKVIFCTTEVELSRISEALSTGADEYIMKPFDEGVLQSKLALVGLVEPEGAFA